MLILEHHELKIFPVLTNIWSLGSMGTSVDYGAPLEPCEDLMGTRKLMRGNSPSSPPSRHQSAALFSLSFIFNHGLQHSGTANHWHGCYQNNMAAQQIRALPSVWKKIPKFTPMAFVSHGLWRHPSQMETEVSAICRTRCFLDPYQGPDGSEDS